MRNSCIATVCVLFACESRSNWETPLSLHGECGYIQSQKGFLSKEMEWTKSPSWLVCLKDTARPLHSASMYDPKTSMLDLEDRSLEHQILDLNKHSLSLSKACVWSHALASKETVETFRLDMEANIVHETCKDLKFIRKTHSLDESLAFKKEAAGKEWTFQHQKTPKAIWSFWDKGIQAAPPFEQRVAKIWRRLHPDWSIKVLNLIPNDPDNALNFLDLEDIPATFHLMHPVLQSDFVRLAVLKKHGGIWMDLSVVLTKHLSEDWLSLLNEDNDLVGFTGTESQIDFFGGKQHLESYMFAVRPNHPLITAWLKTLSFIFEYRLSVFDIFNATEMYFNPFSTERIQTTIWNISRDYLAIYISLRKTLEDHSGLLERYLAHSTFYSPIEDGGLWFLHFMKWRIQEAETKLFEVFDPVLFEAFKDRGTHKFINLWAKKLNTYMRDRPQTLHCSTVGRILALLESRGTIHDVSAEEASRCEAP